jgi:hypothetical protein
MKKIYESTIVVCLTSFLLVMLHAILFGDASGVKIKSGYLLSLAIAWAMIGLQWGYGGRKDSH